MKKKYKKVYSISQEPGYRNYTVRDLIDIKGKVKLSQIMVSNSNEAKAAEEAGVDLMLVIGAENSSNSQRLVEVAKVAGAGKSLLISDKDAIDWEVVNDAQHIGLSAGASAPESLVKDVVAALCERYQIDVSEKGEIRETVNFKLPAILTN